MGKCIGNILNSEIPRAGQMIDFAETEKIDYYKALELAEENGNMKLVKKLLNREPPYYGKDLVWKSALYLN